MLDPWTEDDAYIWLARNVVVARREAVADQLRVIAPSLASLYNTCVSHGMAEAVRAERSPRMSDERASDPVAEARQRLERNIAAEAGYQWDWSAMPSVARDDWSEQINALIAAVRASRSPEAGPAERAMRKTLEARAFRRRRKSRMRWPRSRPSGPGTHPTRPRSRDMAQYRKKPVVIRAVQWRGDNWPEIAAFHRGDHFTTTNLGNRTVLNIATLEGVMTAEPGDWIIEGVKGEVYPCKPDIFAATYEPAEDGVPSRG